LKQLEAVASSCIVSRTHNTFGDRSFAAAGLRALNNLPSHLRQDISHGQFKRQLNTFLLRINRPQPIVTVCLFAPYEYSYVLTNNSIRKAHCGKWPI